MQAPALGAGPQASQANLQATVRSELSKLREQKRRALRKPGHLWASFTPVATAIQGDPPAPAAISDDAIDTATGLSFALRCEHCKKLYSAGNPSATMKSHLGSANCVDEGKEAKVRSNSSAAAC
ncbi:hypothetical protein ABPG75_005141 [Micractinium tetrahymenae]